MVEYVARYIYFNMRYKIQFKNLIEYHTTVNAN